MLRRSRWRVALAATTVGLVAAAPLVAAEPAFAAYPPAPGLEIDDNSVSPGDPINFTATGYQRDEQVVVSLVRLAGGGGGRAATAAVRRTSPAFVPSVMTGTRCGDEERKGGKGGGECVLGTFIADANGIVTGTVTIPKEIRRGTYLFKVVGRSSRLKLTVRVTVERDGQGNDHGGSGNDHGGSGNDHGGSGNDHGGSGNDHGGSGNDHGGSGNGHGGSGNDHGGSGNGHGNSHNRPGHGDNGSYHDPARGDGPPRLADTGSSDAPVALLTAAGGLLLLGGGTLVIAKRRRTDAERG
ncbi:LPXTG cell wall anchor domain-containing protein [Streptomyces sp. NBC_01384]|uniref:LPXTG cell wall anchor domain-containing protein n=1 Tax=Streptomyces sp. NBC_01384 TaxID=2903847 RepID=UPI0032463745